VDIPVSFMTLSGSSFSCSPFRMMVGLNLLYIVFTTLRNIPSIPIFFRAFIMKGCWILSKAFSAFLRELCVLCLACVYMLYYIYGFTYVEPSLHPWHETNLIMVYDHFDMLNSLCQYFLENLCICIH
jgi:hypothetical protein